MKKLFLLLIGFLAPLLTFAQELNEEAGIGDKIDGAFGWATGWFVDAIFYSIPFSEKIQVPWVLIVLVGAAVYFTIYFRFINFSGFFKAINVVRGKYDELEEHGEASSVSDEVVQTVDGDNLDTIKIEKSES
ncbi:MAG: D-alanine glycine permease, partial [Flavobacteriales bacterium]|nr:D-alanine glycine permease [Flavobacteriales bacterium]